MRIRPILLILLITVLVTISILVYQSGVKEFYALVLGAAITLIFTLVKDLTGRETETRDLYVALAHELAVYVARCQYDLEHPWGGRYVNGAEVPAMDCRKFSPEPPSIFRSAGYKIAMLEGVLPGRLIKFYQALGVWREDLMNFATEAEGTGKDVPSYRVKMLSMRLVWALKAALPAINEMRKQVREIDNYMKDAIALSDSSEFGPKFHEEYIGKPVVDRIHLAFKKFSV